MTDTTPQGDSTANTPAQAEETKQRSGWLSSVRCYLTRGILLVLILATTYLTAGRLLMPLIERQTSLVEEELSTLLGTEVSIGGLNADWYRLGPILGLENLEIIFPNAMGNNASTSHAIKQLYIKPNIIESIRNRTLVIEQLTINEIHCELVEAEDGSWSLVGVPSGDSNYTDQVLDLLLSISDLQLIESQITLHTYLGSQIKLGNAYLQLQNQEQAHLLQLQVRVDDQATPIQLTVEIEGDPRLDLNASAYLSLNNIEFSKALEGRISNEFLISALSSSAQVWLDYGETNQWRIQGQLDNLNMGAQSNSSELAVDISNGSANFTVLQGQEQQWQFWLENPQFDFFNRPWESGDFYIELDTQESAAIVDIKAQEIDISIVNGMLSDLALPEEAKSVLEALHPEGFLNNVQFKTDLSGSYPNGFELSANLEDVSAGAWTGAPALAGINGYVQAGLNSGFVELDSQDFDIHLPNVFQDAWHYDFINSRVHWDVSNDGVKVNSSVIDVGNENIHGRVQFDLYNWRDDLGEWVTDLNILVGAIELNANQKSLYLPTLPEIKETMTWLDQALLSGTITNSGFVYRGLSSANLESSSTVQTFYNVENGALEFLPDWPHLEDINAFVQVSDNDVDIAAQGATISGISLGPTVSTLRPMEQGSWLSVQGNSQTSTALGLDFIRTSPIKDELGDYINDWRADGQIDVGINLGIPINNQSLINSIEVSVLSESSTLEMPEYALIFEDIRGVVDYSNVTGLAASGLSGSLFDFPLVSKIETSYTQATDDALQTSEVLIKANGRASITALQNWSGQSEFVKKILNFAEGEVDYFAEFKLFSEANEEGVLSRLDLSSELPGVRVDLPSPFYKELDEIRPLEVGIEFMEEREVIELRYDNNFYSELFFKESDLAGGQINFGSLNQDFEIRQVGSSRNSIEVEPGLVVTGNLGFFNFEDWMAVSENFMDDTNTSDSSIEELVRIVDLNIGNLSIFDTDLFQVSTVVKRLGNTWDVYLENDLLGGNISVPDDDNLPLIVDLSYLRFEEDEEPEEGVEVEEIDALANVDPSELINFNFSTAELSIGERNLGAWQFEFQTNGNGATISSLKMLAEDASISDLSSETGANIDWRYSNGQHTSSFNGLLHAGDLAVVLPSWGYGAHVQSESADFISNLQWPGSPVAFSLLKSSGQIDVDITNGSFVDINSDGARIFAAFNFDAIVKRLKLDFSDVYEKGFAYDSITGRLNFNEGIIVADQGIQILGASSTISIEGEIDLVNETIDADMLVNVPFSQSIAVVAGMLSAWPIAIGSYIGGKIFKNQLEDFTTIIYRLEGPWAELSTGFEAEDSTVSE